MLDYKLLEEQAKARDFTGFMPLDAATISLKPEVRQMCRKCSQYGKRWSCPPGCGTLAECAERIAKFKSGILVQTVGVLEDEFDGEGMMAAETQHKEHFAAFSDELRKRFPGLLALGSGCCGYCRDCSYPAASCRFPDKMISSMEAYGMLVLQVCEENGLPYYYGKRRIAYTSCFLLE